MKLDAYIDAIDKDELHGVIAGLIRAGFEKDEIRSSLPRILDDLVPFDVLISGPVGAAAEAFDGPVFKLVVDALFPLLWRKAQKRAAGRRVVASVSDS